MYFSRPTKKCFVRWWKVQLIILPEGTTTIAFTKWKMDWQDVGISCWWKLLGWSRMKFHWISFSFTLLWKCSYVSSCQSIVLQIIHQALTSPSYHPFCRILILLAPCGRVKVSSCVYYDLIKTFLTRNLLKHSYMLPTTQFRYPRISLINASSSVNLLNPFISRLRSRTF